MSIFTLTRILRPQVLSPTLQCRRWFAEIVNASPSATNLSNENSLSAVPSVASKAVDWRKEKVPVREDHGLYAFFRRVEVKPGAEEPQGEEKYEVLEPPGEMTTISGRGWKSEELRLKSFKDLHTLWYVLLRERNLLASQKEEVRRMGVASKEAQVNKTRVYYVRKSMARIKQVLNERRLAYEKAAELAKRQQEVYHNIAVMKHFEKKRDEDIIRTRNTRKELRRKAVERRETVAARQVELQARIRAKTMRRAVALARMRRRIRQSATTSPADTAESSSAKE